MKTSSIFFFFNKLNGQKFCQLIFRRYKFHKQLPYFTSVGKKSKEIPEENQDWFISCYHSHSCPHETVVLEISVSISVFVEFLMRITQFKPTSV